MSAGVLQCDADVTILSDGTPSCSGTWTLVPVPAPFDMSQLDPSSVAAAFGVGFSLVMFVALTGFGCRAILGIFKD